MMLTVGLEQPSSPTGKLTIGGCVVGYFENGRFLLADGIKMEMARGIATFFYPTVSPHPGVAHISRVELAEMVEKGEDVAFTTALY